MNCCCGHALLSAASRPSLLFCMVFAAQRSLQSLWLPGRLGPSQTMAQMWRSAGWRSKLAVLYSSRLLKRCLWAVRVRRMGIVLHDRLS